ncbi:MAG TPA: Hsp20/alpha crystallin family protein [Trueperaceae bacterium]
MALVRRQQPRSNSWNLASGSNVPSLFQEFDQLFNQLAAPSLGTTQWTQGYPIDLFETGEELVLQMAVPGVQSEDLDISIEGRELSIQGNLPQAEDEARRYWLQTIPVGEFRRTLTLPVQVEVDNVSATVENGLLTLRMPKQVQARARKISISNR